MLTGLHLTAKSCKRITERGFTLVETIIGLMILVLTAAGVFFGLMQINYMASVARLYTTAQFIVQSSIDTMLIDTPFIPQNSKIPTELTLGTTTSVVPIYVDPITSATVVSGTLTQTVSDLSNTGNSEYYYGATVRLAYKYRGKSYQVIESTVRGSDQ